MSLFEASKEIIYLKRLFKHVAFYHLVKDATIIFCDSQSAYIVKMKTMYTTVGVNI